MKNSNQKLKEIFGAMKGSDFSNRYSLYKAGFSADKKTRRIARLLMAMDSIIEENEMEKDGGKGSGNWGHAGRPGKIGGSQAEKGMTIAGGKHFRGGTAETGYYSKFTKEERRLVGAVMQIGNEDRFIELLKDTGIEGVGKDEKKLRNLYRGLEQALNEHGISTGKSVGAKPDLHKDPPKDIDAEIDDLEKQREELAKKIEAKKAEREKKKKEAEEKAKKEAEEKERKEKEEKERAEKEQKEKEEQERKAAEEKNEMRKGFDAKGKLFDGKEYHVPDWSGLTVIDDKGIKKKEDESLDGYDKGEGEYIESLLRKKDGIGRWTYSKAAEFIGAKLSRMGYYSSDDDYYKDAIDSAASDYLSEEEKAEYDKIKGKSFSAFSSDDIRMKKLRYDLEIMSRAAEFARKAGLDMGEARAKAKKEYDKYTSGVHSSKAKKYYAEATAIGSAIALAVKSGKTNLEKRLRDSQNKVAEMYQKEQNDAQMLEGMKEVENHGEMRSFSKLPTPKVGGKAATLWSGHEQDAPGSMKNYEELKRKRTESTIKSGKISEDEVHRADDVVTGMMQDDRNSFAIRCKPKTVDAIFESHFMNQIELQEHGIKDTGGYYGPSERAEASTGMFGTDRASCTGKDYEIYGYLGKSDFDDSSEGAEQYGSTIFHFKKERMAGRSTFTFCDSLGAGTAPGLVGADGSCIDSCFAWQTTLGIKELSDYSSASGERDLGSVKKACGKHYGYIEMQYHGNVDMNDVESVCFASLSDAKKCKHIHDMKEMGIKVYCKEKGSMYEL